MNKKNVKEFNTAIICSGLGSQNRGFENYFKDLHEKLKHRLSLTLIKGAGEEKPDEVVVPNIRRDSFLLGGKNSRIRWGRRYRIEQLSFFVPLTFHLLAADYDLIQISDPDLAIYLDGFKRYFSMKYKILFTNAFPCPPSLYTDRFDHIHQVSKHYYDEGLQAGLDKDTTTLIPYCVDTGIFAPPESEEKEYLREKYGIPKETFVILSSGSIDKTLKRMDYLIQEVSHLENPFFLFIAGQENHESESIKELAGKHLANYRFATLTKESIHEIYKLSDLFVLCSLKEGFGLVFLEAMASGLPTIAHKHPNMEWILKDSAELIDMTSEGTLRQTIDKLITNYTLRKDMGIRMRNMALERFDWNKIIDKYLKMYKKTIKS